jgi:aminoethylphosphonate catabolism LysR family transcriptional regulator
MSFPHIRAFHAVAVHGSVVKAARTLGVTQPTLSQQIKALEDRYKARLFEHAGRRLNLTALGRDLLAETTRLMTSLDSVEQILKQSGSLEIGGRLQVGSDGPQHAAAMLAEFRKRHPAPEITLIPANARQTMQNIIEGRVDVAIVADPPGEDGFAYIPIGVDPLWVLLPTGHPLAHLSEVPLEALRSETLLMREPGSKTRFLIEQIFHEANITPREMIEFGTRESIREGVALGLGLGIFVSSECGNDSRIICLPLATLAERAGLAEFVVCRQQRRHQACIRAFIDIAQDYAAQWQAALLKRKDASAEPARTLRAV